MAEDCDVYGALERHFLTYSELITVPVQDNGDALVVLGSDFSGSVWPIDSRMEAYTSGKIFVRSKLVPMLEAAQHEIRGVMPDCDLEVVYGYRHPDVQRQNFQVQVQRVLQKSPSLTIEEQKEAAHCFSAVPEVAGHPTGGAVDVRIKRSNGEVLPMGTAVGEYCMDTYVFSPFIEKGHWHNRQILRLCMLRAGFAPFDGEWWHFSFGDREWARYLNRGNAIYEQVSYRSN